LHAAIAHALFFLVSGGLAPLFASFGWFVCSIALIGIRSSDIFLKKSWFEWRRESRAEAITGWGHGAALAHAGFEDGR
jgi:hypothetical protein